MEGSGQQALNSQAAIQVLPEGGHELRSSIGYNGSREAVYFPDVAGVQSGNLFSVAGSVTGDKVFHFC
jgi:hypothetical protein